MGYGTFVVTGGYTPEDVWNAVVDHSVRTGNQDEAYKGSEWLGNIYTFDDGQVLQGGEFITVFSDRRGNRGLVRTLDELGIRDMLDVQFEPSRLSKIGSYLLRLIPGREVLVA